MEKKEAVKIERIFTLDGGGATKAFCDILLMDNFLVKGLRVIKGKEGLFVSMPTLQGKDGKWYETFYPVSQEMRKGLEAAVLDAYSEKTASVGA